MFLSILTLPTFVLAVMWPEQKGKSIYGNLITTDESVYLPVNVGEE